MPVDKFFRLWNSCAMAETQHEPIHKRPPDPTFHWGDRLEKALDVSGVKVAEMALRLGVSRQTIGNYLAGRTTPKLGVFKLWAEVTDVDLDWLLYGPGEPAPVIHATQLEFDFAA